jgi:hypothetical protein
MPVNPAQRFVCSRVALLFLLAAPVAWAFAGGSVSGAVTDPSGGTIPQATVTVVNTALKTEFKATSDAKGFYSFPALPVGHYDLTIEAPGFQTQKKTDIGVYADSAIRVNLALGLKERNEQVTVSASSAAVDTVVETVATHLGEVVQSDQIAALTPICWLFSRA